MEAVLLLMILSLIQANANQYCDNLLKQHNAFKSKCSPDLITINSCCDLTGFTLSKAPSAVYQMMTNCTCRSRSPFKRAIVDVYCDMNTTNGGWIVIQRNREGSPVSFNRKWKEYEDGFGDLNGDFWYGLESIHCLTQYGQWEMRVDFKKQDGSYSYIHYNQFKVGSASEEYKLTVEGYTGGDGDYFKAAASNMKFSTIDNDNDLISAHCASSYNAGWWYKNCYDINPNRQPPVYA